MDKAGELIAWLHDAGHPVIVCTNASEKPPAEYAAYLREKGIPVRDEEFITAGSAAADFVAHHHAGGKILVLGTEGIRTPLRELGGQLIEPGDGLADAVIVGAGENFTRAELNAAALSVEAGAPLYTTVAAQWFHGGTGKSICISAAMAHAVGWVTDTEPQVLGKPSTGLGETLIRRLGVPPKQIGIVGDATAEIDLAHLMGATSVLVLSGAVSEDQLNNLTGDHRPDVVLRDVAELYSHLANT